MEKLEIEGLIKAAFKGVKLDGGISLCQSRVQDNWGKDDEGNEIGTQAWLALPRREITDNWLAIPAETLNSSWSFSHLVERGFRYYLPAFMLNVLSDYKISESASSLLFSLCPKKGQLWDYYMLRYSLLDSQQRFVVAKFLFCLPELVELDSNDSELVAQALKNYWN